MNVEIAIQLKLLGELQEEVKTLTDSYLQATEEVGTVSLSSILMLAKSELLQRQLQIKIKALSCLLSKLTMISVMAIQETMLWHARSKQKIVTWKLKTLWHSLKVLQNAYAEC